MLICDSSIMIVLTDCRTIIAQFFFEKWKFQHNRSMAKIFFLNSTKSICNIRSSSNSSPAGEKTFSPFMVQQSEMLLKERERGDWKKQKSCNEKSKLMLWKEAMSVCHQFMRIASVSFHFISLSLSFFLSVCLSLWFSFLSSFVLSCTNFLSLSCFLTF